MKWAVSPNLDDQTEGKHSPVRGPRQADAHMQRPPRPSSARPSMIVSSSTKRDSGLCLLEELEKQEDRQLQFGHDRMIQDFQEQRERNKYHDRNHRSYFGVLYTASIFC